MVKLIETFNPNDPRTEGEQFLIDVFKESSIFDGFTIFEEPHVNSMKPDFVLIHPSKGIVIIEVKDWNLESKVYLNDGYILGTNNKKVKQNPIDQVEHYKNHILKYNLESIVEISDEEDKYLGLIETVVYFHKGNRNDVHKFLGYRNNSYTKIWTKEDVEVFLDINSNLTPDKHTYAISGKGYKFKSNKKNQEICNELIKLLNYSDYNYERVEPLKLDYEQNKIAKLKYNSIRRWGGVVGSGKTVVLCEKAVKALKEGNKVLIVFYNITLRSNIRDLCSQQMGQDKADRKMLRSNLTIIHFHELLKTISILNGLKIKENNEKDFTKGWIEEIRNNLTLEDLEQFRYDSILIDEGQDFKKEWVILLKDLYKKTGEFFITYDRDQDLYNHSLWLENPEEIKGLGFRGEAGTLGRSKRLPSGMSSKINKVFNELDKKLKNILVSENEQFNFLEDITWNNQVNKRAAEDLEYIYEIFNEKVKKHTIMLDDITILTISDDVGVAVANFFKSKGISLYHTYDLQGERDIALKKKEKWKFNNGTGRLKISSYHSFKGWESPNIIFILDVSDHILNKDSNSIIENGLFISMSRVKESKKNGQYSYTCLNYINEYNYLEKKFIK